MVYLFQLTTIMHVKYVIYKVKHIIKFPFLIHIFLSEVLYLFFLILDKKMFYFEMAGAHMDLPIIF